MAAKKIFSIGFEFPGDFAENLSFRSEQSLLDADIVVFEPRISDYITTGSYRGKQMINHSDSFALQEDASHWRSELKVALNSGKTILVFLSKLEEVYVHTSDGELALNEKELISNYSAIPLNLGRIVPRRGKEIRVVKDLGVLAAYWKEFGRYSTYEVYLEGRTPEPILTTKTGNKTVGCICRKGSGTMILLPPIRWDENSFVVFDEKEKEQYWSDEAVRFGKNLATHIFELDKALSSGQGLTPAPDWTSVNSFKLKQEIVLQQNIKSTSNRIQSLQDKRSKLLAELENAGTLRRLLYEKGRPLEEAIIQALSLMGFKAKGYRDAESEFDAVFVSPEGRFLGEAEGKDNKPISIDKLSQLERNLQEDFAKDEVTEFAKGALFGNAFRLRPLSDRPEFFTAKCKTGARRCKVALVRTTDLFEVAKYLQEHRNRAFAKRCREALFGTQGEVVQFPKPPKKGKRESESQSN